ncbi:unnamed protein product [Rotaria sp. Silwood2]|nr:unnamed protein product [Rotaria sp. Silwood2]
MSTKADNPSNAHEDNAHENDTHQDTKCKQDEFLHSDHLNFINNTYISDEDDTDYNEDIFNLSSDISVPLYENSHISVKVAATSIMSMAIEPDIPKHLTERILKFIKTLSPIPHCLPTIHRSILKSIGVKPTSSSKFYCNSYLKLCALRSGHKFCDNEKCELINKAERNGNISEAVTLDIKQPLNIFGFASLFSELHRCGIYETKCENSSELIVLNNTETMGKECSGQMKKYELAFTLGIGFYNLPAIIVGMISDYFGPRCLKLIAIVFHLISWLSLGFVAPNRDWLLLFHTIFLSLAGICTLLSSFSISANFSQRRGLVTALISGAQLTSSIWYAIFQVTKYHICIHPVKNFRD